MSSQSQPPNPVTIISPSVIALLGHECGEIFRDHLLSDCFPVLYATRRSGSISFTRRFFPMLVVPFRKSETSRIRNLITSSGNHFASMSMHTSVPLNRITFESQGTSRRGALQVDDELLVPVPPVDGAPPPAPAAPRCIVPIRILPPNEPPERAPPVPAPPTPTSPAGPPPCPASSSSSSSASRVESNLLIFGNLSLSPSMSSTATLLSTRTVGLKKSGSLSTLSSKWKRPFRVSYPKCSFSTSW
mmetsp:Transcript_14131/g.35024  ORF Transcript_14131/g.35024 Transcript_14131/m.35024 type:complete len:245 (-) Transcript_14131:223-957(-)